MDLKKAKEILGEKFSFTAVDTNRVIQDLDLNKNSTILVVGTGIGSLAITLALNGYRVTTGEPKSDNSEYAKQDWRSNSKKVRVDHLLEFKHFDAKDTQFESNKFDAIFFLGSLHHIDKDTRVKVFQESARIAKPSAIICFFEPNSNGMKVIMEMDPSHPEAADPSEYSQGLDLLLQKKVGEFFDAFIFKKISST